MVSGGIAGDALQCVDAADPHVQFFGAKLLDRFGISIGYLTFAG